MVKRATGAADGTGRKLHAPPATIAAASTAPATAAIGVRHRDVRVWTRLNGSGDDAVSAKGSASTNNATDMSPTRRRRSFARHRSTSVRTVEGSLAGSPVQ